MARIGSVLGSVQGQLSKLSTAKPSTYGPLVLSPIRQFDVTFQPSPSNGVALFYTIVGGSGNATYDLLCDEFNPPSTVRASAPLSQNQISNLVYFVGAGWFVNIRKTGPGQVGTLLTTEVIF